MSPVSSGPGLRPFGRVWRFGLLSQTGGLLLTALFFHLILRVDLPAIGAWTGPLLILLAGGWALVLHGLIRPLRAVVQREGPSPSPRELTAAYLAGHELPYRAAGASFLLWLLLVGALGLTGAQVLQESTFRWVGMMLGAFVISFGANVYQLIGQRLALRPLLERLSTSLSAGVPPGSPAPWRLRIRYTLRFKLILSFTALVFFACALALFITFVQSHELVDSLQGAASQQRVQLLGRLLERGEQDLPLQRGEGLVLLSSEGTVLSGWGRQPDPGLLRELASYPEGSFLLTPRGLLGAVVELADPARSGPARLVLVVPRPDMATRSLRLLIFFMSLMFLGAAGLVHLSSEEITGPISSLSEQARQMASGSLERPVPVGEADEIGLLSCAVETMRARLKEKLETIEELNTTLEQKVKLRTAELEQALTQLKASEIKLVQSEKMASLGQLVAGVAHEINNPVNFVLNTLEPLRELVEELLAVARDFEQGRTEQGLRRARAAGLEQAEQDVLRMLEVMRNGAERTRRIVADLRSFSRLNEAGLEQVRLEDGITSTLNLLRPSIPRGVQVETCFALEQPVLCHAGQLNQIYMNLLNNAVQAVGPRGNVRVETAREDPWAVVRVEDDGPGIPEGLRHRIFDPFFTTKDVGQGTGLGLSISLGIATKHGGELVCENREGGGARFVLRIPLQGPPAGQKTST